MNLKEQLKPEAKQELNEVAKMLPVTVELILEDLEKTNYLSDLKYFTVLHLQNILELDVNKFSSIRNLFNR